MTRESVVRYCVDRLRQLGVPASHGWIDESRTMHHSPQLVVHVRGFHLCLGFDCLATSEKLGVYAEDAIRKLADEWDRIEREDPELR